MKPLSFRRGSIGRGLHLAGALLAALTLCSCARPHRGPAPAPAAAPDQVFIPQNQGATAAPRVSGLVGTPSGEPPAQIAMGVPRVVPPGAAAAGPGEFALDFADADLREVVGQVLGGMLGQTYAIDPAVRGTVTFHAERRLAREELVPTLQALLASNGAAMVSARGMTRIVPAASAGGAGARVVPLRFVSAEELAKVLQPMAGGNAKVAAENGLNALILSGDPAQIDALQELIGTFDVDALAGQSYALLPVASGNARDFAEALQEAFRGRSGASLAGVVRVSALNRLGAVLVIAAQPRYIEEARRIYGLVERERRATVRSWRIYYLQNSAAEDVAFTLQSAFTPNSITAVPKSQQGASGRAGMLTQSLGRGSSAQGGASQGASGQSGMAQGGGFGGQGGGGQGGGAAPAQASGPGATRLGGGAPAGQTAVTSNPLLGGLEATASGGEQADSMRVLPDDQNNAVLIYGTAQETDTIEAMLRKIDILPMQVRIDATIAEVTLNDQLKYGTQFYFRSGGVVGALNNAAGTVVDPTKIALGAGFPGFLLGGTGSGGAPVALSALQAITTVNVLSSPQLVVVDNQPARLQVGSLVPYLNASAQSTLTSNAPVVSSISYQPTGVIMDITPRVNSGGLVTLDITQEVSDVDTTTPKASGIDSPTFQQRIVSSRVVVQDGQTVGIAGLIRDSASRSNSGLPWLKDVPLLGVLAGTQDNQRGRTELLVLITPHVIRSQREAHDLTEDMREALPNAAGVPGALRGMRPSGSNDPSARVRQQLVP